MSANDIIQSILVAVVAIGCIIWLVRRIIRRHNHCNDCDANCPFKKRKDSHQ